LKNVVFLNQKLSIFKGIVSRDFGVFLYFYWIDVKIVIGPDQVYFPICKTFSYLNSLQSLHSQNVGFAVADPEIVTFRKIFATFNLNGLNQHPRASNSQQNPIPSLRAGNSRQNDPFPSRMTMTMSTTPLRPPERCQLHRSGDMTPLMLGT
jgi:hypothetical protein